MSQQKKDTINIVDFTQYLEEQKRNIDNLRNNRCKVVSLDGFQKEWSESIASAGEEEKCKNDIAMLGFDRPIESTDILRNTSEDKKTEEVGDSIYFLIGGLIFCIFLILFCLFNM